MAKSLLSLAQNVRIHYDSQVIFVIGIKLFSILTRIPITIIVVKWVSKHDVRLTTFLATYQWRLLVSLGQREHATRSSVC